MDQLINLILLVASGIVTVVALLAAVNLFFPRTIQKVQQNVELAPGRSTLLGLVNFLFFGAILVLFLWLAERMYNFIGGIFILLAGLIGIGIAVLVIFGLAAFANLLGNRMGSEESSPFKISIRGGLLLVLAGIAPYVGWLIFTPLVVWTGFGAAIPVFVRRREKGSSAGEAA